MKKKIQLKLYINKQTKKIGLVILTSIFFSACATSHYNETSIAMDQPQAGYGVACPTPKYIATESAYSSRTFSASHLSVAELLVQAKEKYGSNVTIQNIHWDLLNGIRVSATYDVITCIEVQKTEVQGIVPVKK